MVSDGEKVFGSEGKRLYVVMVVVVTIDEECEDGFPTVIG
jgi:hypothetical protein